ncbi:carboxypeptidase Q-like [Plodia interpunctella]|uniref:carboxypeptidase Q-like n=1 Tax=Plodia interpunctella TaxID=58824 RepID=UPI002367AA12|nr:carboxypeptidase Q-like [Plodia interpunctella]
MHSIFLFILIFTICFDVLNAKVISNHNVSDTCNLDNKLIEEIASYKNVTEFIMNEIISKGLGQEMYKEYTDFIDKFGARVSGSENLEKSIDYMINLTISHGLTDVTTEEVDVPHYVRGHESLQMISPRKKNMALIGLGASVATPPEGITADVIVIKSFQDLDQTQEAKIKGKIVLFDAHYVTYGKTVIYRTQGASRAAKKGAVASLVRSVTPFSIYSTHTGAQFYDDNVTKIPTAAITLEDADLMRRMQERGEKITVTLKMSSTFDMKKSRNTIIDIKGKENPNKVVIVSGHIDSWDVGQGAMDDGGGMIISWFAPVFLNIYNLKPRRTLRAILWTAEEPGLIGAAAYLRRHLSQLSDINFVMESDEGTFKPRGLDVAGSKTTRCIIAEILKLFTPVDEMTNSGGPGSDITMIINKGVPGASLLNKNERYFWYHHSEGDTLNVQNKNEVINCAAFWTAVSYVIADISKDLPRS